MVAQRLILQDTLLETCSSMLAFDLFLFFFCYFWSEATYYFLIGVKAWKQQKYQCRLNYRGSAAEMYPV